MSFQLGFRSTLIIYGFGRYVFFCYVCVCVSVCWTINITTQGSCQRFKLAVEFILTLAGFFNFFGWMWSWWLVNLVMNPEKTKRCWFWLAKYEFNYWLCVTIKEKLFTLIFISKDTFFYVYLCWFVNGDCEKKTPGKDKIVLKTELRILFHFLYNIEHFVGKIVESKLFPTQHYHTCFVCANNDVINLEPNKWLNFSLLFS